MSCDPIEEFEDLASSLETLVDIYNDPVLSLHHPYRTQKTLETKLLEIDQKISLLRDHAISKPTRVKLDLLKSLWILFKKELDLKCKA